MPLDTEVKGDPDSLTVTCDWIRSQASNVQSTGDQVYGARGESESGWGEAAGDAARSVMTQAGRMIDTLHESLTDTCRELETHADDLRTVRRMMQDARDIAAKGGLTINGFQIHEPGKAPGEPKPLPYGPVTTEMRQQHAAAVEAQAAFERKAKAYAEASQIVNDARKKETDSQHVLMRFLSGTFDPTKLCLTLTDMAAGTMAAVAKRTSQFREFAEAAMGKADRWAKVAASTHMTFSDRMTAAARQITNEVNAKAAREQAVATRAARVIDNFPEKVKRGIRAIDAKLIPESVNPNNSILKGSVKLGQRIPIAGVIFTGLGVGYDIAQGKDPTQAIVSGGSSLVTGAVAGAAIGGPVGAIAGGVVGLGVGFAVDELWPD